MKKSNIENFLFAKIGKTTNYSLLSHRIHELLQRYI